MASSLEPGSTLGKYRIVRLLDRGGMGAVFEAEHTVTEKRVAIKCMRPEQATKPKSADRLVQEARAAARIRHPNVVDVYDIGHDDDTIFLVMEYLEGETLTKLMKRGGIPMHQLIGYLVSAMRGVAAAHRQRIVHRDIKPDNIFLANEEDTRVPVPKVLDFGISKLESLGAEPLSLTRSGSTVGTPSYMSIEQLNADRDLDGRADVYAFGVILYEALTGVLPYAADSYVELIVKVMGGKPVSPSQLRPEIPLALDRLILWALQRDRDQRIASVELLIRELEPFASEAGFRAQMTSRHAPLPMLSPLAPPAGADGIHESTAFASGLRGSKSVNPPAAGLGATFRHRRKTTVAVAVGVVTVVVVVGALLTTRAETPLRASSSASKGPPALPFNAPSATQATVTAPASARAESLTDAHAVEAQPPAASARALVASPASARAPSSVPPSVRPRAEPSLGRAAMRKPEPASPEPVIEPQVRARADTQTVDKQRPTRSRASGAPLPASDFY